MRRRPLTIALAATLCAVLAVACGGGSKTPTAPGAPGKETATAAAKERKSWAGTKPAPEFPGGLRWFGVDQAPTLAGLRGRMVLLDFWTLGCINCQHIIPDLKRLEAEFGDALVVVGVHSGKYDTEHDDQAIREAIKRFGLRHPVVNDAGFAVWKAYGAKAWPTLVLVDPAGNLAGSHAGEGVYALFQPILTSLLAEFEAKGAVERRPLPLALEATATSTVLSYPADVVADEKGGRLFIADAGHNRILAAGLDGRLRQAIGSGKEGFADGAAHEAAFRQPQGLGLSEDGTTLFVADTRNHAVRAVDLASGEVRTIAGTGKQLDRLPRGEAKASETALASPWDVLAIGRRLFISMAGVHQIWVMDLDRGTVAVFAGTSREGVDDGAPLTMATLAQPSGLATDGTSLFWVDPESSAVRRLALDGQGSVATLAGTGLFDFGDRDGDRRSALLQHPQGIAFANGKLYIGDTYNHKLRVLDPKTGLVATAAGSGERGWADGPAPAARFHEPAGLSVAANRIYVADQNSHLVRVFDPGAAQVSTLTLSNLAVAAPPSAGRREAVQLALQEVAPGTANLRVVLRAPAGYHLNAQAPSELRFATANAAVIEPGEERVTWSSDEASVTLPIPVLLGEGSSTLTATASVYYCQSGSEALCLITLIDLVLPVRVSSGSRAGELLLEYTLPGAG